MDRSSLLEISNLQILEKTSGLVLLNCPELQLYPKEILGVCGRSGVGKSLLLKTIAMLTPFDSNLKVTGAIQLNIGSQSYSILSFSEKEMKTFRTEHFGLITQEPLSSFNPGRQVGKHLLDIIRVKNQSQSESPQYYLSLVGLGHDPHILKSYPAELSGGQLQRVSVACAFAQHANIVLCDEPTSSLDVHQRDQFYCLVHTLRKDYGKSFIVVSHDLGALSKYCDRVVSLDDDVQVESTIDSKKIEDPASKREGTISEQSKSINGKPPVLSIQHVSYEYRTQSGIYNKVLSNINLVISTPRICAITGASGCGKTTLARIISGDYLQYKGQIKFNGKSLRSLTSIEKSEHSISIQYVFQDALEALNPFYSIRSILKQTIQDIKRKSGEFNFQSLDAFCHHYRIPAQLLDRLPRQLSGGERQRINLARALLYNPKLLILDEPLSGIDYQDKYKFYVWLKDIFTMSDTTVLWITHDLYEVKEVADLLFVIHNGEIVESGKPKDLFENPSHEATISMISASSL